MTELEKEGHNERMTQGHRRKPRGTILTVAVLTAFVCSIAAYLVLFLAVCQARQARFYKNRMRARYAAEAAVVWAQQRLFADPAYCIANGDGPVLEGYQTKVTVTNCGAGNAHVVRGRVPNY